MFTDEHTGIEPYTCEAGGYHNNLIRVLKNKDFDYLYIQRHSVGIKRDVKFEYAGIYCKQNGLVYDGQYALRALFVDLDALEAHGADALYECLKTAVRSTVESIVSNDRNNLRITELSSEQWLKELSQFQEYTARENARRAYLHNEDDSSSGGFVSTFCCRYNPERWTEDSLLEYILDSESYVRDEAREYINSHQEVMLFDFLKGDMVASEYEKLIENPSNPVHCIKRIMRAVSASPAKTISVTIRKDGIEFTFKAEAREFRLDCTSYYSDWNFVAADRREFIRLFGQNARCKPEDILRIKYARSVLYENEIKEANQ